LLQVGNLHPAAIVEQPGHPTRSNVRLTNLLGVTTQLFVGCCVCAASVCEFLVRKSESAKRADGRWKNAKVQGDSAGCSRFDAGIRQRLTVGLNPQPKTVEQPHIPKSLAWHLLPPVTVVIKSSNGTLWRESDHEDDKETAGLNLI